MPGYLSTPPAPPPELAALLARSLQAGPLSAFISHLPLPSLPSPLNPLDALTPFDTTPLAYAATAPGRDYVFRLCAVALLLERGADPDALSSRGRSFADVVEVRMAKKATKEERNAFVEEVNEARRGKKEGRAYEIDEEVYDAIQRLIRAGNGDEAMEEDGEQQQRVLGDQYTMASPELQSPVNGGYQDTTMASAEAGPSRVHARSDSQDDASLSKKRRFTGGVSHGFELDDDLLADFEEPASPPPKQPVEVPLSAFNKPHSQSQSPASFQQKPQPAYGKRVVSPPPPPLPALASAPAPSAAPPTLAAQPLSAAQRLPPTAAAPSQPAKAASRLPPTAPAAAPPPKAASRLPPTVPAVPRPPTAASRLPPAANSRATAPAPAPPPTPPSARSRLPPPRPQSSLQATPPTANAVPSRPKTSLERLAPALAAAAASSAMQSVAEEAIVAEEARATEAQPVMKKARDRMPQGLMKKPVLVAVAAHRQQQQQQQTQQPQSSQSPAVVSSASSAAATPAQPGASLPTSAAIPPPPAAPIPPTAASRLPPPSAASRLPPPSASARLPPPSAASRLPPAVAAPPPPHPASTTAAPLAAAPVAQPQSVPAPSPPPPSSTVRNSPNPPPQIKSEDPAPHPSASRPASSSSSRPSLLPNTITLIDRDDETLDVKPSPAERTLAAAAAAAAASPRPTASPAPSVLSTQGGAATGTVAGKKKKSRLPAVFRKSAGGQGGGAKALPGVVTPKGSPAPTGEQRAGSAAESANGGGAGRSAVTPAGTNGTGSTPAPLQGSTLAVDSQMARSSRQTSADDDESSTLVAPPASDSEDADEVQELLVPPKSPQKNSTSLLDTIPKSARQPPAALAPVRIPAGGSLATHKPTTTAAAAKTKPPATTNPLTAKVVASSIFPASSSSASSSAASPAAAALPRRPSAASAVPCVPISSAPSVSAPSAAASSAVPTGPRNWRPSVPSTSSSSSFLRPSRPSHLSHSSQLSPRSKPPPVTPVTYELHRLPPWATESVLRHYLTTGPRAFENLKLSEVDHVEDLLDLEIGFSSGGASGMRGGATIETPPPIPRTVDVLPPRSADRWHGRSSGGGGAATTEGKYGLVKYSTPEQGRRAKVLFEGRRMAEGLPVGEGEVPVVWVEMEGDIERWREREGAERREEQGKR